MGSLPDAFGQLVDRWQGGQLLDLGAEVIRQAQAGLGGSHLERAMHAIRDIPDLDHLRHVHSIMTCGLHVSVKTRAVATRRGAGGLADERCAIRVPSGRGGSGGEERGVFDHPCKVSLGEVADPADPVEPCDVR